MFKFKFNKIKTLSKTIHDTSLPNLLSGHKRKTKVFYVALYMIATTIFLTIIGQSPFFASHNITQLFQIGWVLSLIPLFILDYKRVLKSFLVSLLLLVPFLVYCLVTFAIGGNPFSYTIISSIFLSCYIFLVGFSFGKYITKSSLKFFLFSYLTASLIYAFIVFTTKLVGNSLDNQIYVFGEKNSAGPIFMSAVIIAYYIFSKRSPLTILIKWTIILFFLLVIILSKTRAVLVAMPFILVPMILFDIKNKAIGLFVICGLFTALLSIFLVPTLYQKIVIQILFNGKNTIDGIFSGRLTQIMTCLGEIKPIFGGGNAHVDCMPIYLLCAYGIIGLISLSPLIFAPYLVFIKIKKRGLSTRLNKFLLLISLLFIINSLFEGFGYFGPGGKTFILWLLCGFFSTNIKLFTKENRINTLINRIIGVINSIKIKPVISAIWLVLLTTPCILVTVKHVSYIIGSNVVERLPATNKIAIYKEVKDITIDPPVSSMCVGQKITFNAKSDPIDAYDKTVFWSTAWVKNPCIEVDGYTGEVTATKSGNALLHINKFRVGTGSYIQFTVSTPDTYNFDNFYISNTMFKKSFDTKSDCEINLTAGCTATAYYDTYYVPSEMEVKFISSNPDVATVDQETGLIRAKSPGQCEIFGSIQNSYNNKSINKIIVNVNNDPFIPVKQFNVDISNPCFQYSEYAISPIFNNDASDQRTEINVSGLAHKIDNNIIQFMECGVANVKVSSQNDKSFFKEFELTVLPNHPIGFVCETNRMKIGEKKDAKELGLYLCFSNGDMKIVTENDIEFDPKDMTGRAWSNQNGLIENRTTVMAVKKGDILIELTSKIDHNIKGSFKILCNAYSATEYDNLSFGFGLFAFDIIMISGLLFSVFVNFKKEIIIYVALGTYSLIYLLILILMYNFTYFSLISLIAILFALILILICRLKYKKKFPLLLLEEPIILSSQSMISISEDFLEKINNFEVDI